MVTESEPLIPLKVAARLLPLTEQGRPMDLSSIRRLIHERKGPRLRAQKFGRKWVTRASWVEQYMRESANPSAAELGSGNFSVLSQREAEAVDRRLAAGGCLGAKEKRRLLGVPSRHQRRAVPRMQAPA